MLTAFKTTLSQPSVRTWELGSPEEVEPNHYSAGQCFIRKPVVIVGRSAATWRKKDRRRAISETKTPLGTGAAGQGGGYESTLGMGLGALVSAKQICSGASADQNFRCHLEHEAWGKIMEGTGDLCS